MLVSNDAGLAPVLASYTSSWWYLLIFLLMVGTLLLALAVILYMRRRDEEEVEETILKQYAAGPMYRYETRTTKTKITTAIPPAAPVGSEPERKRRPTVINLQPVPAPVESIPPDISITSESQLNLFDIDVCPPEPGDGGLHGGGGSFGGGGSSGEF